LLFGELSGHPLSSIESLLSNCYKPIFEACEVNGWGKADEEQRADFMGEMDHFVHNLAEVSGYLVRVVEVWISLEPAWEQHEATSCRYLDEAERIECFNWDGSLQSWGECIHMLVIAGP